MKQCAICQDSIDGDIGCGFEFHGPFFTLYACTQDHANKLPRVYGLMVTTLRRFFENTKE